MNVTLHSNAKKSVHSSKEGYYIPQTDHVNKKPCWIQENGGNAIWWHISKKKGFWIIGTEEKLGGWVSGIYSTDDVEDPTQALTWNYWSDDWKLIDNDNDIFVTKSGNI